MQTVGTPGDVQANIAELRVALEEAAAKGVAVVVTPELFLSGRVEGASVRRLAEPSTGPSLRKIRDLAGEFQVAVVVGYAELAPGEPFVPAGSSPAPAHRPTVLYNAALVIDSGGEIICNHRKGLLSECYGEERLFHRSGYSAAGVGVNSASPCYRAFELDGLRCGVLIGEEIDVPEPLQELARHGAVCCFVLGASSIEAVEVRGLAVDRRAAVVSVRGGENAIYVAYANYAGKSHPAPEAAAAAAAAAAGGSTPTRVSQAWPGCESPAVPLGLGLTVSAASLSSPGPPSSRSALHAAFGGGSRLVAPTGREMAFASEAQVGLVEGTVNPNPNRTVAHCSPQPQPHRSALFTPTPTAP